MKHQIFPVVSLVNQKPVTTSLNVAEVFGKQHTHVLRAIQNLEVPEEFNRSNFGLVNYIDAKGEPRPMYQITRDGFTILVMGFTGARAMQFKLAYLEKFNRMEAELTRRTQASGRRIAPEVWAQIRQSHRGIKLGLRVRFLDICCQMGRLAEAPQSKEDVLLDYADLCETMRERDALPPAGAEEIQDFLAACCAFGPEHSVLKEDLYHAYREYAAGEGQPALARPQFFRLLYQTASVRRSRPRNAAGEQRYSVHGLALAGSPAEVPHEN